MVSWKLKAATFSVLIISIVGISAYWRHHQNKEVVAWIGNIPIEQSEFLKEMHYRGGVFAHELDKQVLLDEMIIKKLMLNKAYELGYHEHPDTQRDYEHLLVGRVRKTFLEGDRAAVNITDDDIERYYLKHQLDYQIPQKDRFAIVFFKKRGKSPNKRSFEKLELIQQLAIADKLPKDTKQGFGKLSISNSEHQVSRYKGGDIGWFSKGEKVFWEKPVLEAGFSLKNLGDISDIIETEKGYYIVRLMQREEATSSPFETVKARIRHQLILSEQRAVKNRFNDSLREDFRVSINKDKLEKIELDQRYANDTPPVIPPDGMLN